MVLRSLVFGTLFMLMDTPPGHGQMNSALIVDLMLFNSMLIWKMWVLASPMMMSLMLSEVGIMACFLDGPFVVCCILRPLLSGLGNTASCISRIFLFGRAGNTSLILRILAVA